MISTRRSTVYHGILAIRSSPRHLTTYAFRDRRHTWLRPRARALTRPDIAANCGHRGFLGDYVDRGPDAKGVVDLILALRDRTNVVTLKGNHEQLFLDFLESPESTGAGLFILNGGGATLASYSGHEPLLSGTFEIPEEHMDFFYGLKLSFETATHFFVHAGVPLKKLEQINEDDENVMLWGRQPFLSSDYTWTKKIVHGHTPVNTPEVKFNRINVDTGCVYEGYLTALELPSGRLHQIKHQKSVLPAKVRDPRLAVRFTGRMPVTVALNDGTTRNFETLNFNQFGLLMRDHSSSENAHQADPAKSEKIKGSIGPVGPSAIQFEGVVVRVETMGEVKLYGVSLTRVTNGNDGREWIERA